MKKSKSSLRFFFEAALFGTVSHAAFCSQQNKSIDHRSMVGSDIFSEYSTASNTPVSPQHSSTVDDIKRNSKGEEFEDEEVEGEGWQKDFIDEDPMDSVSAYSRDTHLLSSLLTLQNVEPHIHQLYLTLDESNFSEIYQTSQNFFYTGSFKRWDEGLLLIWNSSLATQSVSVLDFFRTCVSLKKLKLMAQENTLQMLASLIARGVQSFKKFEELDISNCIFTNEQIMEILNSIPSRTFKKLTLSADASHQDVLRAFCHNRFSPNFEFVVPTAAALEKPEDKSNLLMPYQTTEPEAILQVCQEQDVFSEFDGRIHALVREGVSYDARLYSFDRIEEFEERARQDSVFRYFVSAHMYEDQNTSEGEKNAFYYYELASQSGVVEAINNLAWLIEQGKAGRERNITVAMDSYTRNRSQHPMIEFNALRCHAVYQEDTESQFKLGEIFDRGGYEIERNHLKAITCYENADKKGHKEAAFLLGVKHKNGEGIPRNYRLARDYFRKAAEKNHVIAIHNLAKLAQWGLGGEQNLMQAFQYYLQGAELDYHPSQRQLAFMYEKGLGVSKSYTSALLWYEKVAAEGHVSGMFNAGRMHQYLSATARLETSSKDHDQQAATWYHRVLEKIPTHAGAAFLLAHLYEQQRIGVQEVSQSTGLFVGVKKFFNFGSKTSNSALNRALELFTLSADQNHIGARLKLSALRGSKNSERVYNDLRALKEDIQLRYLHEEESLQCELNAQYTLYQNLGGNSGQVIANITVDYRATQDVLATVMQERESDSLRIHGNFIAKDPFLRDYAPDYRKEASDEAITPASMHSLSETLGEAYRSDYYKQRGAYNEAWDQSFAQVIESIFLAQLEPDEATRDLKRMFVWWYQRYTSSIALQAISEREHRGQNRLIFQKGTLVSRFMQNLETGIDPETNNVTLDSRCQDGIHDFLQGENWRSLYLMCDGEIPLGVGISKILSHYKKKFIDDHANPIPGAEEEATETVRLLRERMRLPLGLGGSLNKPFYPLIGQRDYSEPSIMMERFLRGGEITFTRRDIKHTQVFQAYTSQLMIDILQQAQQDPDNPNLTNEMLNSFIQRDAYLRHFYEEAFLSLKGNAYFDPLVENPQDCFLSKLFEYLLIKHGYLIAT